VLAGYVRSRSLVLAGYVGSVRIHDTTSRRISSRIVAGLYSAYDIGAGPTPPSSRTEDNQYMLVCICIARFDIIGPVVIILA
jgi:hypothetical protein